MRLLIPSYDYKPMLGGIAAYTYELANEFHKENLDILVLTRKMPNDTALDSSVSYKTKRFFSPKLALASLPFMIHALREQINIFRPDAIFCPLWFPDAVAVDIAQKQLHTKIPFFFAAHGTEVFNSSSSLKQSIRNCLLSTFKTSVFKNANKIFPVSHYTKNAILQNHTISEKKIKVINNGVNTSTYVKTSKVCKNTDVFPKLLTVSRLLPYKGIDTMLLVVRDMIADFPNIQYTIIGQGPDFYRLQNLIKKYRIEKHVTLHGAKPQQDIVSAYNEHDLFVLLSRHEPPDVEGFGLVFLEAAACGLPSIGGNSGGIPDAIENDKTGWLVNPLNSNEITLKLKSILKNPSTIDSMAQSAWKNAQKCNWNSVAKSIIKELYDN